MKNRKKITSFRQYREQFFPKDHDDDIESDPYIVGQQLAQQVLDSSDLTALIDKNYSENTSSK